MNPKTPWRPESYEVAAIVKEGDRVLKTIPLKFAGETSHFKAHVELADKGVYEFAVYAYDPKTGNTGVDITTVIMK